MKRKFAVIMSAALAAGSTMPVMAESETAFTPSTYVGEFSLTADGESMLFSVTAEQFAEDGVSVSANVTLPRAYRCMRSHTKTLRCLCNVISVAHPANSCL